MKPGSHASGRDFEGVGKSMETRLFNSLRGAFSLLLFSLNTIFWAFPIVFVQFVKLLIPMGGWRRFWGGFQNGMGILWISFNNLNLRLLNPARWNVELPSDLSDDDWYVVVANHQSWVDILVLQKIFNGRIPFLKFFLKKELFWVPFLGLAWWSLDYPFLERSRSASKDLETIRRAAEKFKVAPVSVMNFVEGTRFQPEKHQKQRSPYAHLLKPKAGGLTSILNFMGDRVPWILDVTIAYPGGAPSLWQFLCGDVEEVRVRVQKIPVTRDLRGDLAQDKAFRRSFLIWLKERWNEKDQVMEELLTSWKPSGRSS